MSRLQKDTFTREEAIEQVRTMARLFGLIFYHFSNLLVEELGEKKGRELVAEAVKRFGLDRAKRVREEVTKMGLEPTLENYGKVLDLPRIGWGGPTRETFCPFAQVWIEKGAEDLCKLYCDVDIWKYVGYNSKIKVKRLRSVLEGDRDCRYEVKEE
ncbi:MAG: L-2-amino-thiazoline-4-carboxylic acid hydrolase [archaeon]